MNAKQLKNSIAYCGLICGLCQPEAVCSCKGNNHCGKRMAPQGCYQYNCCRQKGLDGCWQCGEAPCGKDMLTPEKVKLRAFIRCMKEDGIEQFAEYIATNQEKGIVYHRSGIMGDYDLATEEEVLGLLRKEYKTYGRMLDKSQPPTEEQITAFMGKEACNLLVQLETALQQRYELTKALRFPFGKSYGWGYKYSHKGVHLCYAFLEQGAFTVTLQIGDSQVPRLAKVLDELSPKTKDLWENRYPCGEKGGWVHYRVLEQADLADVICLINVKKPPKK